MSHAYISYLYAELMGESTRHVKVYGFCLINVTLLSVFLILTYLL